MNAKADSNNTAAASNSMFTVSGNVNTNSNAAVSYNGQTYDTPLKMETLVKICKVLDCKLDDIVDMN